MVNGKFITVLTVLPAQVFQGHTTPVSIPSKASTEITFTRKSYNQNVVETNPDIK